MIEYGIITPNSNTVLTVTTDRAEAERALDWITDARIVARTVTYSDWLPENAHNSISTAASHNSARLSPPAAGTVQASSANNER